MEYLNCTNYNVVPSPSITYNGSMESPIPLYPTDCPPPYEAVMGQRALSQVSVVFLHLCASDCVNADLSSPLFLFVTLKATVFDPHGNELSGERGASIAFSGEGEEHHLFLQAKKNKRGHCFLCFVLFK